MTRSVQKSKAVKSSGKNTASSPKSKLAVTKSLPAVAIGSMALILLASSLMVKLQALHGQTVGGLEENSVQPANGLFEQQSLGSTSDNSDEAVGSPSEHLQDVSETSQAHSENNSGSHTSVSIKTYSSSQSGNETTSQQPAVTINNQEIPIPENGRINTRIKDENSTTRIRARIDTDSSNSTSINIQSTGTTETEADD